MDSEYQEALNFSESKYSRLVQYYILLERIFAIEWFIIKMQFRSNSVIKIEDSIESGCLYWTLDSFDKRA